jgi:ribosome modulation factor
MTIEKTDTSLTIAYKAGRAARMLRKPLVSCPWTEGEHEHRWIEGWMDEDADHGKATE